MHQHVLLFFGASTAACFPDLEGDTYQTDHKTVVSTQSQVQSQKRERNAYHAQLAVGRIVSPSTGDAKTNTTVSLQLGRNAKK